MDRLPAGRMRQLIRCHRILDRLANSRIGYNASQLAEDLGYTPKTIYRDLRALREAGVHIWYQARFRRFRLAKNRLVKGHLGEVGSHRIERDPGVGELRIGLREAGRYLGISPHSLKERLRLQEIPIVRNGGRVHLKLRDLVRYKQLRQFGTVQQRERRHDGRPDTQTLTRQGLSLPTAAR
ncbi:MAG: HTH domain-containing protein [Candidatus Methylomirabilales bacterium]